MLFFEKPIRKSKNKGINFYIIFFFLFFILVPLSVKGFEVFFEIEEKNQYLKEEEIIVKVKIDPKEKIINATDFELIFDNNFLEFFNFEKENSIICFWPKEPEVKGNKISFVGGIPNGFRRIFFGTFFEANELISLKFKARNKISFKDLKTKIFLGEKTKFFLNDGKGTEIEIKNFFWKEKDKNILEDILFLSGILYNGIRWQVEKIS